MELNLIHMITQRGVGEGLAGKGAGIKAGISPIIPHFTQQRPNPPKAHDIYIYFFFLELD